MVKTTDSGHQSFTFVLFCWLLAENFKKSADKKTYEVFMTGVSVFSDPPCITNPDESAYLQVHKIPYTWFEWWTLRCEKFPISTTCFNSVQRKIRISFPRFNATPYNNTLNTTPPQMHAHYRNQVLYFFFHKIRGHGRARYGF